MFFAGVNGKVTPTTPPIEKKQSTCADSQADVAFLIDGSASVGDADFQVLKQFLYNIISGFEFIRPDGFRISIIQYNESPRVELGFEDSTDQQTVLDAIIRLSYRSGNTRTGLAMDSIYTTFENIEKSGDRPGVSQVVVIITDGRSQDDVLGPALALKQAGVKIFAIGVTDITLEEELMEIASDPDEDIFIVKTYGMIDTIKSSLLKKICAAVQGSFQGGRLPSETQ